MRDLGDKLYRDELSRCIHKEQVVRGACVRDKLSEGHLSGDELSGDELSGDKLTS